jgi:hypothetical protein
MQIWMAWALAFFLCIATPAQAMSASKALANPLATKLDTSYYPINNTDPSGLGPEDVDPFHTWMHGAMGAGSSIGIWRQTIKAAFSSQNAWRLAGSMAEADTIVSGAVLGDAALEKIGGWATAKWITGGKTIEHHIIPQAPTMEKWFHSHGVDPHDFTIKLPTDVHNPLHRGKGTGTGGPWITAWKKFIQDNPNATRDQIIGHADDMMSQFGIKHYYTEYRRYSFAKKAKNILGK